MRYELNFEVEPLGGAAELDQWSVPSFYKREEGVEPACREYREWLQKSLNKIQGLNLDVDGEVGFHTNNAIRNFRKENGLGDNTKIDLALEVALVRADATLPPTSYPPAKPGAAGHLPWIRGLLPLLEKYRGDIPLSFLIGWIAVETGGCVGDISPCCDERGYFQIHPKELKNIGLDGQPIDHDRLATDFEYSVRAGIELVRYYMKNVMSDLNIRYNLDIKSRTEFFWRMVKFQHTGIGDVKTLLSDMNRNGKPPTSWQAILDYVKGKAPRLKRLTDNVDHLFERAKLLTPRSGGTTPELYFETAGAGGSEFELHFEAEPFQGYVEFDEFENFDSENFGEWSEEVRRRRAGPPPARFRGSPRRRPQRRRPGRPLLPVYSLPFANLRISSDSQGTDFTGLDDVYGEPIVDAGDDGDAVSSPGASAADAATDFDPAADALEFNEWE